PRLCIFSAIALGALSALATSVRQSYASPIVTLADGNSLAQVDVGGQGMFSWMVNGQNQLSQQWFWYRIGSSAPEPPISAIGTGAGNTTTVSQPSPHLATVTYATPGLIAIAVKYSLAGSPTPDGSSSSLGEQIDVSNLSGSALDMHFFQYSNFDLNGTADNDG